MKKYSFKLKGVECSACLKLARMDLMGIPGISEIKIDEKGNGSLLSEFVLDKDEVNKKYFKNNYFIEELDEA